MDKLHSRSAFCTVTVVHWVVARCASLSVHQAGLSPQASRVDFDAPGTSHDAKRRGYADPGEQPTSAFDRCCRSPECASHVLSYGVESASVRIESECCLFSVAHAAVS